MSERYRQTAGEPVSRERKALQFAQPPFVGAHHLLYRVRRPCWTGTGSPSESPPAWSCRWCTAVGLRRLVESGAGSRSTRPHLSAIRPFVMTATVTALVALTGTFGLKKMGTGESSSRTSKRASTIQRSTSAFRPISTTSETKTTSCRRHSARSGNNHS